jgi:hypothetical protein
MNTLFTKTALGIVTLALLLPAAAVSGVRPDDRAGIRGIGAAAPQAHSFARPDDRAGPRGAQPDAFMRYLQIHRADVARSSSGIDWTKWLSVGGGSLLFALVLASFTLHMIRGRSTAVRT